MNRDAVGAVSELVGSIAVVITLVYLATQVRQGNLSARIAARLEMTRQYSDFSDGLINNPDAMLVEADEWMGSTHPAGESAGDGPGNSVDDIFDAEQMHVDCPA